jgi:sugar-specific transcriptional regulator TrmB
MNTTELRQGLTDAGLSKYQSDAYIVLLELGSGKATEIAEAADIPKSRVYDILRNLEDKGYVETYEQDTLHARAQDPSEKLQEFQTRANRLADTAEEIRGRWQRAEVNGHRITVVKRPETVIERARSNIQNADNEIQLSATPKQFEQLIPALKKATDNDVFTRVSFNTSREQPTELPEEAVLADTVTEARHRPLPAPFLVLVDRRTAGLTPHSRPIDQYGILVEDETLTYMFHWYFQAALWETWESLFVARDDTRPTEYVDLRECIMDITPLMNESATVRTTITGKEVTTGEQTEISGEIVDIHSSSWDQYPFLPTLAGQAMLVVKTDGGREVGIGGWGAMLEDIEALRITIESIEDGHES